MTLAIIIPIYNQAQYLRDCLESLVVQTDGDFTAYCVNDGLTDDSQAIIDEYVVRDTRFVAIRQPNRGVSAARNAGLAAVAERGGSEAYLFLDADDFLHAQCIEFVRRAANEHPGCIIEFAYTSRPSADEFRKRMYELDLSRIHPCQSTGTAWNKLYPRSVLGGLRFAEDVHYAEYRDVSTCWLTPDTSWRAFAEYVTLLRGLFASGFERAECLFLVGLLVRRSLFPQMTRFYRGYLSVEATCRWYGIPPMWEASELSRNLEADFFIRVRQTSGFSPWGRMALRAASWTCWRRARRQKRKLISSNG